MDYKPFKLQVAAHKALLVDDYKFALLYWSRRTGKTLWSIQQIMWSAMLNQGPHFIVFKEYQQAETVAWNQYLHLIPKGLIKDVNKSTLTVTFNRFAGQVNIPGKGVIEITDNPNKPPSSLRLLGSDKADSHRGNEAQGMIFDEYQDQDPAPWYSVYSKFFATTNGWSAFMGTAKDKDHWNEMIDNAQIDPLWYFSKGIWRENPLITEEWVATDRAQAERRGQLGVWLQEMELIPFTQQGAVYPMFTKKIHHIDADKIPAEGTDYIALDFGFAEGHPMAALFVRITRDDVWYQWDEIHGTGIQIDDLIGEIKVKMGDRKLTGIIADSARPDLIDYMASKGMPVIPAPKRQNSVAAGIQLFSRRLKPKIQIIGGPKPNFFIDTKACPMTTYDFTHYRYKEIKEDRHPMENPEKKFDDTMDAIRYLELFFKFGHPKDEKVPQSSMMKEINEFGLL